jgi:flagellar biosynthesis chaperone FliJ
MLLACISMPQYINTYKFLINLNKAAIQDAYAEEDISKRIEKTNELFSEFVNKLEIWSKLEQQYDFRTD